MMESAITWQTWLMRLHGLLLKTEPCWLPRNRLLDNRLLDCAVGIILRNYSKRSITTLGVCTAMNASLNVLLHRLMVNTRICRLMKPR